jgi:hypothetical protein
MLPGPVFSFELLMAARRGRGRKLGWRINNRFSWSNRENYLTYLQYVVPLLYLLDLMAVTGAAAAAMTAEHERDTWVSLTSTDLKGREIVLAKLLGSLRRGSWPAMVIMLMAIAGVIAGSLHPLSVPAVMAGLLAVGFAAAALGIWISLQLRSTLASSIPHHHKPALDQCFRPRSHQRLPYPRCIAPSPGRI